MMRVIPLVPNTLYINNNDGTFTALDSTAGFTGEVMQSPEAAGETLIMTGIWMYMFFPWQTKGCVVSQRWQSEIYRHFTSILKSR
ncbi:MAG: hypothetical protein R2758_11885 [Bacteroidales bacterium]